MLHVLFVYVNMSVKSEGKGFCNKDADCDPCSSPGQHRKCDIHRCLCIGGPYTISTLRSPIAN